MRPFFASNPIAAFLFLVSVAAWVLTELRQALRRRSEARNRDSGSIQALRLSVVAGALLAALLLKVRAAAFPFSPGVDAAALAVLWAGMGIRWWSFHALGRYFTIQVMTSADQPVIASGPYQFLRHPSYLGLLLIIAGLGFTYGNWLSLGALVLGVLIGVVNRIRVEEAALTQTLGSAYTTYAARRKRILPFVW